MTINIHDVYLCTLSEVGVGRGFSAVDPVGTTGAGSSQENKESAGLQSKAGE